MSYGPGDAVDLARVRRALVVKLRHYGDVLLATPVIAVLKNHAPHAQVDALVYADTADMVSLHPALERLHVVDRHWKSLALPARAAAEWRLLHALRERSYDLLVHLSEHPRGAWLARVLGCRHAVAPDHPGKAGYWRRSFTHLYRLPAHGGRHRVELDLDALRRIGIQPFCDERSVVLVPGTEADARITELLAANGLSDRGFIHLHPASRWQFKCWTPEGMAALIDRLHEVGERIVLSAAPEQREIALVEAIRTRTRAPVVDLTGKLTLKMLGALSTRAKLFVGVDSAPMHIAAASGTPVVALFGPSGETEWSPWKVKHRIVASAEHRCRPCGNDGCGGGKVSECLTTIPVEQVLDAVNELLPR
ncbi:MAG: putative lipopolysaccharide heptosyltransferase III [Betaproteobacteria bacterium RIFCSPLOWO2_12_FULL_63_13]|nr:MAG: putative lipopolysaccharide heptosyltransferase III [Betaproteobacteria bacterium RIFCSPLOWO2_02_FULL_63_19]OGA53078.1 MAG: putative lipopolysaccharide heptosyltransferase III [Betaproteobacteria bacterium RIFCSPLOWO2_12_FULL_63_13]